MSAINVLVQTLNDARNLGRTSEMLGRSLSRLSSGTRIVRPSDDPTAVGSLGKLTAQHKRVQAATINVQNAVSFVQSADGFIKSLGQVLSRMSELSQYAADGLKSADDVALYQTEFKQLQDQLRQTVGGTTAEIGGLVDVDPPLGSFNGIVIFGPNPNGISIASGSHSGATINIPETNLRNGDFLTLFQQDAGGAYTLQITDPDATSKITAGMNDLADERSVIGAVGSRLDFAARALVVEDENIVAAVSRIGDVDVAAESTRLTRFNILLESGTAMLSQANQTPKSVLQLLRT
jgi:flagellin